jgi:hypothetical protein
MGQAHVDAYRRAAMIYLGLPKRLISIMHWPIKPDFS